MTLAIRIRDEDPTPPYEQLRAQVAAAIATGELVTGSRLPPVRQLAGDLGLAAGTVARAYKELEAAGLVATARGAGTRVSGHPTDQSALARLVEDFVARAHALGATDEQVAGQVARELDRRRS